MGKCIWGYKGEEWGGHLGDIRFRCHVMKLGIFPCFQEFERRGRIIRGKGGGKSEEGEY